MQNLPANKNRFTEDVQDSLTLSIKPFSELKSKGKISPEFYNMIKLNFKLLYYQTIVNAFTGKNKGRDVISKSSRDSILTILSNQIIPSDLKVNGLFNSLLIQNAYQNYLIYKRLGLNSIDQLQQEDKYITKAGVKYKIDKLLVPLLYIQDKRLQEDLWAMNLLANLQIFPGKFDQTALYQYNAVFPNSKWGKMLEKQFKDKGDIKKIEYKLQMPVVFLDSTNQINDLNSLIKLLPKGKAIFIDCWATWFGPCISAFSFNKQLDAYLNENNIQRLYISLDNPDNKQTWQKAIEKFSLGDYHVLANKELTNDIKNICKIVNPENSPIAIPRYLIVNAAGSIVSNDAISPSDLELLKQQIKKEILLN